MKVLLKAQRFLNSIDLIRLDRLSSSLGVSLSCVVGGMLSEREGSMHSRMHYMCVSLVQNAVYTLRLCRKEACVK